MLAFVHRPAEVQDRGDDLGKPSPEVGEDLAEGVAAAAEDGEDRVAEPCVGPDGCLTNVRILLAKSETGRYRASRLRL